MSDRSDVSKDSQLSFSFAACGWLKMYQFGAALALKHYDVSKGAKFVGSSAGALTAAAIILDVDLIRLKEYALECLKDVRSPGLHSKPFQLRKYITDIADEMLGPARFLSNQSKLSEQLEVVVTVLPGCHTLRYSKYRNYEHFKDVMLASCTASPIAGFPFLLDGQICADGGLSDFQPLIDENTVTLSPFYFHRADIRPSQYVPVWWAVYPGSATEFEDLFRLGYKDAVAWLLSNGHRPPKGYVNPEWLCIPLQNGSQPSHITGNRNSTVGKQPIQRYHTNIVQAENAVKRILRRTQTDVRLVCRQAKVAIVHERYRALHSTSRHDSLNGASPGAEPQLVNTTSISHTPKSDFYEFCFVTFMFFLVRPLTYLMLYIELLTVTYTSLAQSLVYDLIWRRQHSHRSVYETVTQFWCSLAQVNRFVRATGSATVEIDSQILFQQSIVYRIMAYAI